MCVIFERFYMNNFSQFNISEIFHPWAARRRAELQPHLLGRKSAHPHPSLGWQGRSGQAFVAAAAFMADGLASVFVPLAACGLQGRPVGIQPG